jgi:hypothetical protein
MGATFSSTGNRVVHTASGRIAYIERGEPRGSWQVRVRVIR